MNSGRKRVFTALALGTAIHSQIEADLELGPAPDPDQPIPYRLPNRRERRAMAAIGRGKSTPSRKRR